MFIQLNLQIFNFCFCKMYIIQEYNKYIMCMLIISLENKICWHLLLFSCRVCLFWSYDEYAFKNDLT